MAKVEAFQKQLAAILLTLLLGDFVVVVVSGPVVKENMMKSLSKGSDIMAEVEKYNDMVPALDDWSAQVRSECEEPTLQSVQKVLDQLGQDNDILHRITSIALLQADDCPAAAISLANDLVKVLKEKAGQEHVRLDIQGKVDHCDDVAECEQKHISFVRRTLKPYPSLVALYDVIGTAVFALSSDQDITHALLLDSLEDLDISTDNVDVETGGKNPTEKHSLTTRGSCINEKERNFYKKVDWIPLLGDVYSTVSAAIYGAKGCTEEAKNRGLAQFKKITLRGASLIPVFGSIVQNTLQDAFNFFGVKS